VDLLNVLFVSLSSIESNNSAMLGNISIVKGLVDNGCKVTFLVAKAQKNSAFYDQYKFNYKNVQIVEFGDSSTYKLVEISKSNNIIIKFLLNIYKSFSLFGGSRVLLKYSGKIKFNEHFDLVISASDPKATHLFTKRILEKISYTRWIQLWGDPLLLDITSTSKSPAIYKKYIEYSLLKSCDYIIYVSPLTLDEQKKLYKSLSRKMMFFPIPYDEEILYPDTNNKRKILGYFGNYNIVARDITELYNAVKNNKSLELIIAGDSELKLKNTNNITVCKCINPFSILILNVTSSIGTIATESAKTNFYTINFLNQMLCICTKPFNTVAF
jgi:hypothetical protein